MASDLRKLVAQWREKARALDIEAAALLAVGHQPAQRRLLVAHEVRACADELEAALPDWQTGEPPDGVDRVLVFAYGERWLGQRQHIAALGGCIWNVQIDLSRWRADWLWMPLPEPPEDRDGE